jgi:hypothetical protein
LFPFEVSLDSISREPLVPEPPRLQGVARDSFSQYARGLAAMAKLGAVRRKAF